MTGAVGKLDFYTDHGRDRARMRAIPDDAVTAALDWGDEVKSRAKYSRRERRGLVWGYRVTRRSVKRARRAGMDIRRYLGCFVAATLEGWVVTTYRRRAS